MKLNYTKKLMCASMIAMTMYASAGETSSATMTPAPTPPQPESVVSGTLNLDYNSHFISYGADVWKAGSDIDTELSTFNPSLELAWALPNNVTLTLGTWWDVNDNASNSIGGNIQEVDVWTGLAYTFDKYTVSATYQAWTYASEVEQILDLKLGTSYFLSPYIMLHTRMNEGASGGNTGQVLVAGASYGFDLGPVAMSVPVSIAYFLQDDFHGGTEDGLGYGSVGLTGTLPLSFISSAYGKWNLHSSLTYYMTEDAVIPGNPDENFLTANIGIGCAF